MSNAYYIGFLIGILLYIGIIALLIFLHYRVARKFERIAADKGYINEHIFAWCFWMPLVGYLMVIAMPKKEI